MVTADDLLTTLRQAFESHFEWLAVYPEGRTFPLRLDEIEIAVENEKLLVGMPGDRGFRRWRIRNTVFEDNEILLDLSGQFGSEHSVRLIPRTPAAELARNIELARLVLANEIAALVQICFPGTKIVRVALNEQNGRMAQILIEGRTKTQSAILSDVTKNLTPENLLSSAYLWLDRLNARRKRPVEDLWIVGEKKQIRPLRKLHSLLNENAKSRVVLVEKYEESGEPGLRYLEAQRIASLWREKPKKLVLPTEIELSETAEKIVAMAPDDIDVIRSKQGETLRFRGLPFARVRAILGQERSWFGVSNKRRPLTGDNLDDLKN